MNLYYVGSGLEYIEADHALSNRSTCKGCQEKIAKEQARLAYVSDGSHCYKHWFHVKCFVLKPKYKNFDPEQQVYNLDHLEDEDYNSVLQNLKSQCENLNKGIVKKIGASKTAAVKTKAKAKGRKKAKDESQSEQSDEDYSEEQVGTKKVKGEANKKKIQDVAPVSVFSEKEQQDFKTLVNHKYLGLSADQLKKILGLNNQSKSGNKTELAEKCADGEMLGKIPSCPSCGGGKPRFSRDSGTYKCPGYMDDDEFKNCNKTFTMSEITRDKWTLL